jgi:xylulokinase
MAVDLGTSFIKTGIYTLNGICIAVAKQPVKDSRPAPGIFQQKGEDIVASVISCMKDVLMLVGEKASRVAAISFTGQMAGFMGVDREWNDVTGWSCSLDTRYTPFAARQLREYSDIFLAVSGTNSPLFSAKYEWFRHDFPEESKRIEKYLMLNGYVIGKLSDMPVEEAVIDGSLITWTGLADVKQRSWSEEICYALQIDQKHLPRITESSEIVAHLSEAVAKEVGLPSGIPLIAGAGDKIAGCVGADILQSGRMIYEAASFGGFSCRVDDYRPDMEKRRFDILNGTEDGSLYAHYYMPGSGITMEWFTREFGNGLIQNGIDAFDELDRRAEKLEPGCNGLMAVGMLSGTVMPFNGDLKGIWMGFDWSHRVEHFYRALLESHAFALTTAIERIRTIYPEQKSDTVRIIGGGSKSKFGTQLLADVSGLVFEKVDRDDAALWGASILAAKGIGLLQDISCHAADCIHVTERVTPNESVKERYDVLRAQYNRYEKELTPYCRQLV